MSRTTADPERAERDEGYLKLLATLKTTGSGGELGVVRQIAAWIDSSPVLEVLGGHAAWFDDWQVKDALVRNEATPEHLRSRCAQAVGILDLLHELDNDQIDPEDKAEIRDQVRSLIRALPAGDREVVKARALELSSSRDVERRRGPSSPAAVAFDRRRPSETAAFAAESLEDDGAETDGSLELITADGDPGDLEDTQEVAPLGPSEPRSSLLDLPLAARAELARTSKDAAVLAVLVGDSTDEVRLALLENTAITDRQVAVMARTASAAVAREIYRNRRMFQRPAVRSALLECPNVPSAALVEVVSSMGDLRGLLGLTQNPQIRSLEVKARARARLTSLFRGLGAAEKMSTIRQTGRTLLRALWADFFRDEELVLRCLQERHLDPGLLLEIARSSIAPRRALQAIGESPSLSTNYQVRLALARNPKTPRSVCHKVMRTLRPADRQVIERERLMGGGDEG
ncbi:MAG: hypothetical protein SF066_04815 [Thermoanaerobaculia bacterium]|nr:hypothetical protein [Thermoanaerobaculia bacterium]